VQRFHHDLVGNRKSFLDAEIARVEQRLAAARSAIESMSDQRAGLMGVLETHGALEEYQRLHARHMETRAELNDVTQRIASLMEFDQKKGQLKIEQQNLHNRGMLDLRDREAIRGSAIAAFDEYSDVLYQAPGTLSIDVNDRGGYDFGVSIERQGSKGVDSMMVLCYDLVLARLWAEMAQSPGFLVHDSAIFDPTEERQVAHALELAHSRSQEEGWQYICTLNSDRLPHGDFSPGFDIREHVRLTLTDRDISGCLLGIRF